METMKGSLRFSAALLAFAALSAAAFAVPGAPAGTESQSGRKAVTLTLKGIEDEYARLLAQRNLIIHDEQIFYKPGKSDAIKEAADFYQEIACGNLPQNFDQMQAPVALNRTRDLFNALWVYDGELNYRPNMAALFNAILYRHVVRRVMQVNTAVKWYESRGKDIVDAFWSIDRGCSFVTKAAMSVVQGRQPEGMRDSLVEPWAVSGRELLEASGLRKWFRSDGSLAAAARDIVDLDRKNKALSAELLDIISGDLKETRALFEAAVNSGKAMRARVGKFPAAGDIGAILDADAQILARVQALLDEGEEAIKKLQDKSGMPALLRSGGRAPLPALNESYTAYLQNTVFREQVVRRWKEATLSIIQSRAANLLVSGQREKIEKFMMTW